MKFFSYCTIRFFLPCADSVLWFLRQGIVSTPWPVDQLQPAICFYFSFMSYCNPVTSVCLHIVCGCFHIAVVKLSSWDRGSVVYKAGNMYCLALCRKMLPASASASLHRLWIRQGFDTKSLLFPCLSSEIVVVSFESVSSLSTE